MSTSSTSTYNLSAQDIIDLALTDIGVAGQSGGAAPDAGLRTHALKLLNLLLKRLDSEGALLWHIQRTTQTLTSGTAAYALSNTISDIDEPARYTASGSTYGSQVWSMARDEYMTLPDRTIQGVPYRYYAEKSLDATGIQAITLYLYPVPPTTGDTLEFAAVLRMKDVTSLNQTLDIPQNWSNVVRQGLAVELAPSYGVPATTIAMMRKVYEDEKRLVLMNDNERGGLQLVPWGNSVMYGYGQHAGGSR